MPGSTWFYTAFLAVPDVDIHMYGTLLVDAGGPTCDAGAPAPCASIAATKDIGYRVWDDSWVYGFTWTGADFYLDVPREDRRIPDGPHRLTFRATNTHNSEALEGNETIYVDNHPPAAPPDVAVAGGDGWHNSPAFGLNVALPREDPATHAPITGAYYQVCSAVDRSDCQPRQLVSGLTPSGGSLAVPGIRAPRQGQFVVHVTLQDAAGNTEPANDNQDARLRFDSDPPRIGFRADDPADPTAIEVEASDSTSGIGRGEIDYQVVGEDIWRALPTDVTQSRLSARLDDSTLPKRQLSFRALATDLAGNSAVTTTLAGSDRPFVLSLPLRDGTRLELSARRTLSATVKRCHTAHRRRTCATVPRPPATRSPAPARVRYGRHARIHGLLTNAAGQPLAGEQIAATADSVVPGRPTQPPVTLTTDRDGRFTYPITATESRHLTFVYTGAAHRQPAGSRIDELVPASSTIHVSRRSLLNGDTVIFSGRLRGGALPERGKLVILEAWVRGVWQPIAQMRTQRDGRWHASHTFATVAGSARFQFRLSIPHDDAYPFAAGVSRPISVVVRGA